MATIDTIADRVAAEPSARRLEAFLEKPRIAGYADRTLLKKNDSDRIRVMDEGRVHRFGEVLRDLCPVRGDFSSLHLVSMD